MATVMPDLATPTRGVRQALDAAIPTLLRLGIDLERIALASAGSGWVRGSVLAQEPPAGTPIDSQTRVALVVSGSGSLESLPYALREGKDGEFGPEQLFALFDNPLLKIGYHIGEAGGVLDLHPADPAGAVRWIVEIFRLFPVGAKLPWSAEHWYDVARLLPSLHRIGGRPEGPALALRAVFKLPAGRIEVVPDVAALAPGRSTRLGVSNGRLGVDAVVGTGVMTAARARIEIGPVPLAVWRLHASPAMRRERVALYRLVLPANLSADVEERWVVGDASKAARIGDSQDEAVLGVNCYLGSPEPRRAA